MKALFTMAVFLSFFLLLAEEDTANNTTNKPTYSFLVLERPDYPNDRDTYVLQRYQFKENKPIEKQKVISMDIGIPDSTIKEWHVILRNYLILASGDIIDLNKNKLIHDAKSSARLLEYSDDEAIIYDDGIIENPIYGFNLKTYKNCEPDKTSRWRCNIESEYRHDPSKIILSPDCDKVLVKSSFTVYGKEGIMYTGKGFSATHLCPSSFDGITTPVLWVDNTKILTQSGNGNLMIADLKEQVRPVVRINSDEPTCSYEPRFFRDGKNSIIYQCCIPYEINLENKSATPVEWLNIGCDFEVKGRFIDLSLLGKNISLRYNGKEIRLPPVKDNDIVDTIMPSDKCIAIIVTQDVSSSRYMLIWNAESKQWRQIDFPHMAILIDWESPKSTGRRLHYVKGKWDVPCQKSIFER